MFNDTGNSREPRKLIRGSDPFWNSLQLIQPLLENQNVRNDFLHAVPGAWRRRRGADPRRLRGVVLVSKPGQGRVTTGGNGYGHARDCRARRRRARRRVLLDLLARWLQQG